MTRDDIIRMAQEAGFDFYETMHVWTTPTESAPYPEGVYTENLKRFAALVAASEREACAKVCEEHWRHSGNAMNCADAIRSKGKE